MVRSYEDQRNDLLQAISEANEQERIDALFELAMEGQQYGRSWEEAGMQASANYIGMCLFAVLGWSILICVVFAQMK